VAVLQADLVEGRLVAERMLRAVRQLEWPDPVHRPTVSIGVALAGREVTPEQALAAADQAMYAAKRAGGDAVVVADPPPTG
jgi:GGDEF domain-containing protein